MKSVSAKLCAAEICKRELHEFHFRTHLFGEGVALNAFELRNGSPAGYQFQIIGEPQGDFWRSSSIAHALEDVLGVQTEVADDSEVAGVGTT